MQIFLQEKGKNEKDLWRVSWPPKWVLVI
jgi:hypothetical protein